MNAALLDQHQYRKLLDGVLPVAIRTEGEYRRLLGAAAATITQDTSWRHAGQPQA